jgi:hypothetical protein
VAILQQLHLQLQLWRCWLECFYKVEVIISAWRALVVSSPPATEETGAMGREIEPCLGIGW